jgi:hypothetical protein
MAAMRTHWMLVALSSAMLWAGIGVRWGSPVAFAAETQPLLVVVGLGFPAKDISLAALKTAFRGQVTHVAGKPIVPINHPVGTPMRMDFDRLVLGLEPSAVGPYWVDRRIRDEGSPPKSVPTPEVAVKVVAALPTAITYTRASLLTPMVKVLTIDGKSARDAGYALSPGR